MIDKFIDFLRSQVGRSLYVWGAQSETDITEAWIRKRESNNEKQVKRILMLWNKLKAQGISPIAAYDCSGLIVYFLIKNKIVSSDMSSASLYAKSQKLEKSELKKGDFVFRHNGTKIHHVGVYIGDGKVIESIGRDYGVVERDIDASGKDYWNRYGRFTALQKANDESEVLNIALTSPLTRGEAVKSLQERLISLGYDVGKTGADGIYGKNTESAVKLFQERAKKLDYGIYDDNMRLLLGL